MVYDFLATSQEEKGLILSGKKTAQVYFHDFCGREFRAGDKLVMMFPMDHAFCIAEIVKARNCRFSDVDMNTEWPLTGFTTLNEIMQYGQRNHPNFQMDVLAMFVQWGAIILPKEIDVKATTKMMFTETLLRAKDRDKEKENASEPGE